MPAWRHGTSLWWMLLLQWFAIAVALAISFAISLAGRDHQGCLVQPLLVERLPAEPMEEQRHHQQHQEHHAARYAGDARVRLGFHYPVKGRLFTCIILRWRPGSFREARGFQCGAERFAGHRSCRLLGPSACDLGGADTPCNWPQILALQHALVRPRLRQQQALHWREEHDEHHPQQGRQRTRSHHRRLQCRHERAWSEALFAEWLLPGPQSLGRCHILYHGPLETGVIINRRCRRERPPADHRHSAVQVKTYLATQSVGHGRYDE